jgi:signal recognition particle receptor subunit beta
MVLFNYSTKELTAKVVYYGPALCGKTTNLQWIHEKLPIKNKGKMLSLATETDRTLFFDFLPIEIGAIRGMRTRIQLYTVPGQVFYNATRRMVLKGADAIVLVCDSQEPMLEANVESYENLLQNLEANELNSEEIPIVFQFNKRDLPNALPIEILNERLNPRGFPFYEAIAPNGVGVEETLKAVTKMVFRSLSARYGDAAAAAAQRTPGASGSGSLPSLALTSGAPVAVPSGEFLGDLSFTPKPALTPGPPPGAPGPPVVSRPPSSPALSRPPSSPVVSRPPSSPTLSRPPSSPVVSRAPVSPASTAPRRPATRAPLAASLPDALQPSPEDLTMPSPSVHSGETPAPRPQLYSHAPHETLVSSPTEADDLRQRISIPGGVAQEEDLELEEIDLDDSLPMPQALPPDPEPSETVAPSARPATTTEIEVPIEVSVPPGATRIQLRLRLVLNLKQR